MDDARFQAQVGFTSWIFLSVWSHGTVESATNSELQEWLLHQDHMESLETLNIYPQKKLWSFYPEAELLELLIKSDPVSWEHTTKFRSLAKLWSEPPQESLQISSLAFLDQKSSNLHSRMPAHYPTSLWHNPARRRSENLTASLFLW